MQLTRRQEYSLRDWGPAPRWFKHTPTPGKPAPPPIPAYLNPNEQALFLQWFDAVTDGSISTADEHQLRASASAGLQQALADVENNYFQAPDVIAWAHLDLASRDSQWRFHKSDVHAQLEAPSVVVRPQSADPAGVGKNTSAATVSNPGNASGINLIVSDITALDISGASDVTDEAYGVPSGQQLLITDYDFSFYIPSGSTLVPYIIGIGQHTGGTIIIKWRKYAPIVAAAGQTISMSGAFETPILITAGNTYVICRNVTGATSTGAKLLYSLQGFLTS